MNDKTFTLNSPKLSRPGSWKEPHLLKLTPERKKLRVKVADMEQKSEIRWNRRAEEGTAVYTWWTDVSLGD